LRKVHPAALACRYQTGRENYREKQWNETPKIKYILIFSGFFATFISRFEISNGLMMESKYYKYILQSFSLLLLL